MSPRTQPLRTRRTEPVPSDADILARVAAGDIGALGELYDRHHDAVRRFVTRATAGADDVDDLVQAIFLGAAESAPRFDGRPSCRPWLLGIAAHHLRRRRRSLAYWFSVLTALRGVQSTPVDPRRSVHARLDVDRALAGLSEPKRITLLLAEVEGLSCSEVADALGVPIGTVWTRLHAARRELRVALAREDEP